MSKKDMQKQKKKNDEKKSAAADKSGPQGQEEISPFSERSFSAT